MSSLKGSPAPTAWVMIRFFCSSLHSSWEMTTSLNLPKPVVIPYTTFLSSTSSLTTCLEARIFSLLSSDKTTSAPSRAYGDDLVHGQVMACDYNFLHMLPLLM